MKRLVLEGFLVFVVIYGSFWVFTKGTPAQNRRNLKIAGKLAIGAIIVAILAAVVEIGLTQLNHVF